jgi:glycopeptide antibiotics resistance protein
MQKRSITALVLIGYSALLIKVVVFKGPMILPDWLRAERETHAEGALQARTRGAPGSARGESETRAGRGPGSTPFVVKNARLSTSRFAPLHANYVPFKTILPQLRGKPRWSSAVINLIGNTVLFVPVGFLVVLLDQKMRWQDALVLAVGVGVAMELLEGLFRVGVVDIDDVILNALGVMCGYGIARRWARRRKPVVVEPA